MIDLSKKSDINFIKPLRASLPGFLVLLLISILISLGAISVMLYRYLSLGNEIESNSHLLKRYQTQSEKILLPPDIDTKIKLFHKNLGKIEQAGMYPVSSKMLLSSLEASKPDNLMYSRIEYNASLRRCLLEFSVADSAAANEILIEFEKIEFFESVTVLQKDRSGTYDKYLVEIRI